ncbi:MAG: DinB family protein [Gemmatimonas sp.]
MPASNNAPIIPLKEFDHEMETTRKMLERVPDDQPHFKPHERSMEFGYLTFLVAAIPGWIDQTLRTDAIDLGEGKKPDAITTRDILQMFDKNVHQAREALQTITGDKLNEDWSLKRGDAVLMTLPRGEAARQHLSHLVHHRGQLSVYERLLDVKLPQIYGPSADTPWGSKS